MTDVVRPYLVALIAMMSFVLSSVGSSPASDPPRTQCCLPSGQGQRCVVKTPNACRQAGGMQGRRHCPNGSTGRGPGQAARPLPRVFHRRRGLPRHAFNPHAEVGVPAGERRRGRRLRRDALPRSVGLHAGGCAVYGSLGRGPYAGSLGRGQAHASVRPCREDARLGRCPALPGAASSQAQAGPELAVPGARGHGAVRTGS